MLLVHRLLLVDIGHALRSTVLRVDAHLQKEIGVASEVLLLARHLLWTLAPCRLRWVLDLLQGVLLLQHLLLDLIELTVLL